MVATWDIDMWRLMLIIEASDLLRFGVAKVA